MWHTLIDYSKFLRPFSPASVFAATTRCIIKSWLSYCRLACRDCLSSTFSVRHSRQRIHRATNRPCLYHPSSSITSHLDDIWLRIGEYALAVSSSSTTSTSSSNSGCAFIFEHCSGQTRLFGNHATRTLSWEPCGLTITSCLYGADKTASWNVTSFGSANVHYRTSPAAAFVQASRIDKRNWSWRSLLENEQSIGEQITHSTSHLGTRNAPAWSTSRTTPGIFTIPECEWRVRKVLEASPHSGYST